jgi:glucan 1,6-alpha-glucosidase
MVFQFQHIALDEIQGKTKWDLKPLNPKELMQVLSAWQGDIKGAWNSLYWSNHDQPRIVSRWGNDKELRVQSAKMFAILLHFMKGTPYIYQGEEIGMTNAYFNSINQYKDIESINIYNQRISNGYLEKDILKSLQTKSRDNSRTPMQWDSTIHGDFTSIDTAPWLSVNSNTSHINVEDALADKNSIFYTYKKLIQLRKDSKYSDTIIYGKYKQIENTQDGVLAYKRYDNNISLLIICNITASKVSIFQLVTDKYAIVMSNYNRKEHIEDVLDPYEAVVLEVLEMI